MTSLPQPEQFLQLLQRANPADIEAEIARRQAEKQRKEQIGADLEACTRLETFIERAWPVIEPGTPFVGNWHIGAMAEHLEAVQRRQIRRLIINVPPGTSKSTVVGVFFPMWCWGPCRAPHTRFVGVSHEQSLGVRDNLKCRRLVVSDWFQERWPTPIQSDQNEKLNFENTATGFRLVATPSNITGRRGDIVIIDDPISVENANSVVEREKVNSWFAESLPTRLNNPERSAIILVMQRVHEDDPTGMILAKGWGWDHLLIPMERELARNSVTSIGWTDPRTQEGELLFPARFPQKVVDEYRKTLGAFAYAGQMQQRPVPREGAMFKRSWFNLVKAVPAGTRFVRYWDLAATDEQFGGDPAYTVGLKLGRTPAGRFIVADVFRLRAEGTGVRRMIRDTARADGPYTEIGYPQDPGQAGKVQAQDLTMMLAGYVASATIETGDKVTRAEPVAAQAEAGNIDVLEADWNGDFFAELTTFPGSKFKDQVDALSGAFSRLMRSNMFGASEEQLAMEPVKIAAMWGRCAAINVSSTVVTIVYAAFSKSNDAMMIYDVYQAPRAAMPIHAASIPRDQRWVPVLFDLEDYGRSREEGTRIAYSLGDANVEVLACDSDLEAGIVQIADRAATKRLRVFSHLTDWFAEYRRFGRDEKGKIPESDTSIMRATALLATYGEGSAITENRARSDDEGFDQGEYDRSRSRTGY